MAPRWCGECVLLWDLCPRNIALRVPFRGPQWRCRSVHVGWGIMAHPGRLGKIQDDPHGIAWGSGVSSGVLLREGTPHCTPTCPYHTGWTQRQAPALPPAWRHREAPQDQDMLGELEGSRDLVYPWLTVTPWLRAPGMPWLSLGWRLCSPGKGDPFSEWLHGMSPNAGATGGPECSTGMWHWPSCLSPRPGGSGCGRGAVLRDGAAAARGSG